LKFNKKSRLTTKLVVEDFLKRSGGQDRNSQLEKVHSQNCRLKCLVANLAWNFRRKADILTRNQRNTALRGAGTVKGISGEKTKLSKFRGKCGELSI
jgi:hypothetical protein